MQFLNQCSYILVTLFALLVSSIAVALWLPGLGGLLVVFLVAAGFVAAAAVLQYRDGDDFSSTPPDALIGKGLPVLLAVYSNF